ncbi:zinc finger and BTB domain-containing protein 24-like [Aphis craccivora]|uniref:Zinc finger and BTB domain-containing protein 24-like n=1 Tax=Aphis craccivora TaxID=307492 RepID=A0A6G0VZ52_APHCR|nr:zinc finger and BTB domain-containing protein 24-like [Aphis craccivora]
MFSCNMSSHTIFSARFHVVGICSEIFTGRDNFIRHKNIIKKNIVSTNFIIQKQPTITKREIQDFFKPAEQIYDYDVILLYLKYILFFTFKNI